MVPVTSAGVNLEQFLRNLEMALHIVDRTTQNRERALQLINKTNRDMDLEIRLLNTEGELKLVGSNLFVERQGLAEGALFLIFDRSQISDKKMKVKIGIFSDGELIETTKTTFIGP